MMPLKLWMAILKVEASPGHALSPHTFAGKGVRPCPFFFGLSYDVSLEALERDLATPPLGRENFDGQKRERGDPLTHHYSKGT